jgi:hypothetical protein
VVECSDPPDQTYFDRLLHAVDDPKTLLRYIQYLMSLDLANFHPQRDRPITDAYRRMMATASPWLPSSSVGCWIESCSPARKRKSPIRMCTSGTWTGGELMVLLVRPCLPER